MRYNNTICCTPILLITTPFAALNFTALNTPSKQPRCVKFHEHRHCLAPSLSSSVVVNRAAMDKHCINRVTTGAMLGGAVGGAVGAVYGTYEAFAYKVPGLLKVRHIGRATVGSSALFGLFLSAGSLLQCGRR